MKALLMLLMAFACPAHADPATYTLDLEARWQADMAVVVASERLAVQARALGLAPVRVAAGPTPSQMAAAALALHADVKQTR